MKVFITGATGYLGSALLKKLLENGNYVHALCRNLKERELFLHPNLKWYEGDLLDFSSLMHAMVDCIQVYHVAAYARVWSKRPDEYYKQNVIGTKNVLEAAYRSGISRVVMTSTAGVIGPCGNLVADENQQRLIPYMNEYEETKALAEHITKKYLNSSMEVIIVNPTRIYGPGKECRSNPIMYIMKTMQRRKYFFVPASREVIGNYTFIDDVVSGHLLAMEKGRSGERYLLGGDNVSYNHLLRGIVKAVDREIHMVNIPLAIVKFYSYSELVRARLFGHEPWLVPKWVSKYKLDALFSSKKAINELGYRITPLETGLKQTAQSIDL